MSFGEFLFVALLVVPVCMLGFGFFVLLGLLLLSCIDEALDEVGITWREVAGGVTVIAFCLFFAWFVLDCPGCEGQKVPHAVEGREEWIDLREGTTYSQVERRVDE